MHIAFISPYSSERSGHRTDGVPSYVENLIENLKAQRQDLIVDTFATSHNGDDIHRRHASVPLKFSQSTISIESGFRVGVMGYMQILWVIFRRKYDVIHLQHETYLYGGPLTLLTFPLFCWLLHFRGKTVVTLHHVISPNEINAEFRGIYDTKIPLVFIRWGYQWFFRSIGKTAQLLIVHHERFREVLMRDYDIRYNHVAVVPHGISKISLPEPQPRSELLNKFGLPSSVRTVFGFMGFATGYKGLDILIREFAIHAKQVPDTALLICAGEHPHNQSSQSYQQYLHELRAAAFAVPGKRVIWHGFLAQEDVSDFFETIDCLVLPYRSSVSASGILSHAIAYEKQMIVSDHLKNLAHGALISSLEPRNLANTLSQFISFPASERNAMKETLRSAKKSESWQVVSSQTYALYQRLSSQAKRTILLLGAYGQQNLGDELLLAQCLQILPRPACVVASADPKRTEREHAVATIPRRGKPWKLLWTVLRSRIIVVGGGDQFKLMKPAMGRSRYSLLLLDLLLAVVARLFRKHLYFVGVGIGNVGSRPARLLTRWTLNSANATVFRDAKSFKLAQKFAPQATLLQGTDMAFTSHNKPEEGNNDSSASRLGIAPCVHLDQAEAYDTVTRELARCADILLVKEPQSRAVFLPFQTGFATHHDILVSREILDQMQHGERCTIKEDLNLASIHSTYSALDVLWGMRLHSVILACLHAVPFIALIYDVKVKNFLQEINCEQWGISLDDSFTAEKLLVLHTELKNHLPEIRNHLHMQAERLAQHAQINIDLLQGIAKEIASTHACDAEESSDIGAVDRKLPSALS